MSGDGGRGKGHDDSAGRSIDESSDVQAEAGQWGPGRRTVQPGKVVVSFAKSSELRDEFVPMGPAEDMHVEVDGLDGQRLSQLTATARVSMGPGTYSLPIVAEGALDVEVREGTECSLSMRVGSLDVEGVPKTGVETIEITFSRPVSLPNVFSILYRLPSVFADHDVEFILGQVERFRRSKLASDLKQVGKDWMNWFRSSVSTVSPKTGEAADTVVSLADLLRQEVGRIRQEVVTQVRGIAEDLSDVAGRLPIVELDRAVATPVRRRGRPCLDFRFSGRVGYRGGLMRPFRDVLLPHAILPSPHAVLDDLFSNAPLATADLRWDRAAIEDVSISLARMVGDFDGIVSLVGRLPVVEIVFPGVDLGRLWAEVVLPGKLGGELAFRGKAGASELTAELTSGVLRQGDEKVELTAHASVSAIDDCDAPVASRCVQALFDGHWSNGLSFEVSSEIDESSRLSRLDATVGYDHPLLKGGADFGFQIDGLRVGGRQRIQGRGNPVSVVLSDSTVSVDAQVGPSGGTIVLGESWFEPTIDKGRIHVRLGANEAGGLSVVGGASGLMRLSGGVAVEAFPELNIDADEAKMNLAGDVDLDVRVETTALEGRIFDLDMGGSKVNVLLQDAGFTLGGVRLTLPAKSRVGLRADEATLSSTGVGKSILWLEWDLDGRSPVLGNADKDVDLFVEELRQGDFGVVISEVGGVTIEGVERGLYDAHFFNALINPGSEPRRWVDMLRDDRAMDRVTEAVSIFSPELRNILVRAQSWMRRVVEDFEQEGITSMADFLPADRMAAVFSRHLCGSAAEQDRAYAIVRQVVDGKGLDVPALRLLLDAYLPEHDLDFELDRGLRILARVLAPTEPVHPMDMVDEEPLADRQEYRALFDGLPTAAQIYEAIDASEPLSETFAVQVAGLASYLNLEQLEYLCKSPRQDWPNRSILRLRTVLGIKRRVRSISASYGGIAFLPQSLAISMFLGDAIRKSEEGVVGSLGGGDSWIGHGLLGPDDVAVLLHSGLSSMGQGAPVQVNQRLLLDLMASQPSGFVVAVLWELAHRSSRALSGVLYGLLDLEQDLMQDPIDMVDFLSFKTGVSMPRLSEFLAGGRRARESYFEALSETAHELLDRAEPYMALKERLQVVRRAPILPLFLGEGAEDLVEDSRLAVLHADELARASDLHHPRDHKAVADAYEAAFEACRSLVTRDRRAFQLEWFKEFFARNYEALMVLSVVRNVQGKVDDVPDWMETRLGHRAPVDEQELIDAVIDVLYYYEEDRMRLKADPLVRWLLDPPPGRYDFTVVSCMGVITQGAHGPELKDAYRRLTEQRGVRVIRADTQTARSLEFNARKVEEAASQVTTPWGYIGYSQGCANGLMAESRMLGGSPDQQAIVSGLRSRNLLFSAINGSAHGTCGDWKFLRAMVEGDKFLKYYQAVLSRKAIDFALRNIKMLLDSRPFVHSLGGIGSLSHDGVRSLGRDGQFRGDVPTTIIRGIVEPETLPEALEMLANWLTQEVGSTEHDTQVTAWEAVGHPVWVGSDYGRLLQRCDMGGLVQRTHHWSPLSYAVDFATTARDRRLAVYETPKDRHVFPWVEVNARFGIIDRI